MRWQRGCSKGVLLAVMYFKTWKVEKDYLGPQRKGGDSGIGCS